MGRSLGPPWGTFSPRPQKTTKVPLFLTLILEPICDIIEHVVVTCFFMFYKHLSWHLFDAKGTHKPQFRRPLGAIWNTFSAKLEEWKLRFRVAMDTKNKLWSVCVSDLFVIFAYMFSGLVFFMICFTIVSHLANSCIHSCIILDIISSLFQPSF